MNRIALSQEQLKELEYFIRKRGFNNAIEINEILDHFACKVEELMTKNTEITFEQAMIDAHASFGVMGFRPIVKALEESLHKKYKKEYWKTFKTLTTSLKWIPVLTLVFFAGYKLLEYSETSGINREWDINGATLLLFIIYVLVSMGSFLSFGTFKNNDSIYHMKFTERWFSVFPYIVIFQLDDPINNIKVWGCVVGFCYVYIFLDIIASHLTRKKAEKDYHDFVKLHGSSSVK